MGIKIVRYIPTILWLVAILVASFMPSQHLSPQLMLFPHQDKVIHFAMYFGLAFLFLYDTKKSQNLSNVFIIVSIVCITCLSGLVEYLQPILSNRSKDGFDLFANGTGAIVAGSIIKLFFCKNYEHEIEV